MLMREAHWEKAHPKHDVIRRNTMRASVGNTRDRQCLHCWACTAGLALLAAQNFVSDEIFFRRIAALREMIDAARCSILDRILINRRMSPHRTHGKPLPLSTSRSRRDAGLGSMRLNARGATT
jgi:hypothetical protein